jgi:hypothetical protein
LLSQVAKNQAADLASPEENLGKEPEGEVNKESNADDNKKVAEANVEAVVGDSEANL